MCTAALSSRYKWREAHWPSRLIFRKVWTHRRGRRRRCTPSPRAGAYAMPSEQRRQRRRPHRRSSWAGSALYRDRDADQWLPGPQCHHPVLRGQSVDRRRSVAVPYRPARDLFTAHISAFAGQPHGRQDCPSPSPSGLTGAPGKTFCRLPDMMRSPSATPDVSVTRSPSAGPRETTRCSTTLSLPTT